MAIGAQALAVHPGQRDRIDDLFAGQAKHACHDRGGGHFDQHHVVEADLVEAVFQREAALDFVRLDHRREHVLHRERLPADRDCVARQPIGGRENAAQVVGRMPPFRGQPGVVEIQPADHRADIERGLHRIELEPGSGHLGAIGHDGAVDDRPQKLGAGRIFERLEAAAKRIHQAVARRFVSLLALDTVLGHIVGNVDQDLVGFGRDVGDGC